MMRSSSSSRHTAATTLRSCTVSRDDRPSAWAGGGALSRGEKPDCYSPFKCFVDLNWNQVGKYSPDVELVVSGVVECGVAVVSLGNPMEPVSRTKKKEKASYFPTFWEVVPQTL